MSRWSAREQVEGGARTVSMLRSAVCNERPTGRRGRAEVVRRVDSRPQARGPIDSEPRAVRNCVTKSPDAHRSTPSTWEARED